MLLPPPQEPGGTTTAVVAPAAVAAATAAVEDAVVPQPAAAGAAAGAAAPPSLPKDPPVAAAAAESLPPPARGLHILKDADGNVKKFGSALSLLARKFIDMLQVLLRYCHCTAPTEVALLLLSRDWCLDSPPIYGLFGLIQPPGLLFSQLTRSSFASCHALLL